jgi:uncharacterized protein
MPVALDVLSAAVPSPGEFISHRFAFHVMTKPIGPICNLDCKYCFYLEKENLYPDKSNWRMQDAVLEAYVRQYIEAQDVPEVTFAWQGGEPTLLGVDFFRRVVELQRRYANGKVIHNALQTNGTLLDEEWGRFLHEEKFLLGLSIDGPCELHDYYRVDKEGRPTFAKVMEGLALLKRHDVEFNTLVVVNRRNQGHPIEVYGFLKEHGSGFIQFIPLVERAGDGTTFGQGPHRREMFAPPPQSAIGIAQSAIPPVTPWSVEPLAYGQFLSTIFDHWVRRDVGKVFVQIFDIMLGVWMGMEAALCVFRERCGRALALEHNGDLYSCDHYVYPEYKLGNITQSHMAAMIGSEAQTHFGNAKRDTLPRYCRECDVRFACNGECPKHRFMMTPDGEAGLNYLCAGYKAFFKHIDPYMRVMARVVGAGRPAAQVMAMVREQDQREREPAVSAGQPPRADRAPGRNDPCPCGSGRKFKKCCGG